MTVNESKGLKKGARVKGSTHRRSARIRISIRIGTELKVPRLSESAQTEGARRWNTRFFRLLRLPTLFCVFRPLMVVGRKFGERGFYVVFARLAREP
jgi:hypothetical protein